MDGSREKRKSHDYFETVVCLVKRLDWKERRAKTVDQRCSEPVSSEKLYERDHERPLDMATLVGEKNHSQRHSLQFSLLVHREQ